MGGYLAVAKVTSVYQSNPPPIKRNQEVGLSDCLSIPEVKGRHSVLKVSDHSSKL